MKEEDIKLGFGNPPVPTYIYVGDSGNKDCPWYEVDYNTGNKIPIAHRAITGKLVGIKMVKKDSKKGPTVKLDISFQADKRYVIRSGVETYFTRSFLLAAQTMNMLDELIMLVATPGHEQSVVFCKIYYAINEEAIRVEWDEKCKLLPIIGSLQNRMNLHQQTFEEVMSGEIHNDSEFDVLSRVDKIIAEDPIPQLSQQEIEANEKALASAKNITPAPEPQAQIPNPTVESANVANTAQVGQPPPAQPVQVAPDSRVPAPIAVARRTMAPEYYATEIDDVITVTQLGSLRGLVEQLQVSDVDFCQQVMGCDPSDLSVKGADHLIHFAGVKLAEKP